MKLQQLMLQDKMRASIRAIPHTDATEIIKILVTTTFLSLSQKKNDDESFLKYSIVYKCISVFVFDKTVVQTWKRLAIIERIANELKVDEEYSSDSPNVCECCQISDE